MLFGKKIQVTVHKMLDVSQISWCNAAMLFHVRNGAGAIRSVSTEAGYPDYQYRSQLMLNGRPVLQAELPFCSTCTGLLSAGYGIEKIHCPELREIADQINSDFIDLPHSFEEIKPLLGLLKDDYYILADTAAYPTNGEGNFFWNAADAARAVCETYYHFGLMGTTESFPAYLFATQSDECFNPERAGYYKTIMNRKNAPRAIAYHAHGFLSALLDGHHKAYACAELGIPVPTLTIIPMTMLSVNCNQIPYVQTAEFAGIKIPLLKLPEFKSSAPKPVENIHLLENSLIHHRFRDTDFQLQNYPDIQELALKEYLSLKEITLETAEQALHQLGKLNYLNSHDAYDYEKNLACLRIAFRQFLRSEPENALFLAKKLIALNDDTFPLMEEVWKNLRYYRSPETEQLYIDYLVNHDKKSTFWGLVCSYWEDAS